MNSNNSINGTVLKPAAGVELLGVGTFLPDKRITNADLERKMDTSDEWIRQRTGISERRQADRDKGENSAFMATHAARAALEDAGIPATDLDMVSCATMSPDTATPAVANFATHALGAGQIAGFDLNAACSGFVYTLNTAYAMIRTGVARTVAVIGVDALTRHCDYSTYGRGASILFGDAAGAVILRATDDASKGVIAQAMHSDGSGAAMLYVPSHKADFPTPDDYDERKVSRVQMNGQQVFRFAVSHFPMVIEETLELAGMQATDIDHYVCHQSNKRILDAARDRFGLDPQRMHTNIDRVGNTVSASIPLVLRELKDAGRVEPGQRIMFIAFGAGLTWASSLWQI